MQRFLALTLLLSATPATAQTVRLHVLADSVTVGQRFEVAVAVERSAGVQTLFPDPPGLSSAVTAPLEVGEAELLAVRRLPPEVQGSVRLDSAVFAAATFALDSARVGPVEVRLVQGGDTTTVRSAVAYVGVRSLVPADAGGAKGLAPLATFPRALAPWLIAGLLALALLAGLWWWMRHRRAPGVETSTLPPYEEVVVRLQRLEAALPERAEAVKPYWVELSDALRTYLARSLGVPAQEQTTRELLLTLNADAHVPDDAHAAIADLLPRADLVKFAEFVPDRTAHEAALARAREAVAHIEAALHPEPGAEPQPEPAL